MSKTIIWTGSSAKSSGLSLTMSEIANTSHFIGHNLHYMSAVSGGTELSGVTIKQNGTKEAGKNYYSLTATNNSAELLDQSTTSYIELSNSLSQVNTYFAAAAYFIGASGNTSYSDTHTVGYREIRKSNSLSGVGLTKSEVWTESDNDTDTFTYVNFTSLSNAFDKTATTTTDTNAFTVTATKKTNGDGKITANANYTGFTEGEGSKTFDYTVTASDGAEFVSDTDHYTRTVVKTNGITLKNTATTVTFVDSNYATIPDNTKIYINTGSHSGDISGSYTLSTIVTNTTNNCTPFDTKSEWTLDRTDIITNNFERIQDSKAKVTLSAYNGDDSSHSTAGTVVLTAKSHDGKLDNAKDTIQIVVGTPAAENINVNVDEITYFYASGLAGQVSGDIAGSATHVTSVEALTNNIVSITKVTEGPNAGMFAVQGLASGAGLSTNTKWTTDDGAVLYLNSISVAQAITVSFFNKSFTTTGDMNWGDSVYVQVTGGKGDETMSTSESGATINKIETPDGKTGNWYVLQAPQGSNAGTSTSIIVTAKPAAGKSYSNNIAIKHISLTLS